MKNAGPLTVLFITVFIDLLGFGLIIPILPNLVTKLFMKPEWMAGLVAGVYSVAQFLFSPFWGTLSDRFGRRPIILLSVALTALSYLLFSYAVSVVIFSLLVTYRFLAGMGSANISAANAYIADITTKENRAKSMALIGAAFGLGFIFGPPAGGFIKEEFGAEWVGFVAFALCLINLVFAWFWLPESIKEKNKNVPFSFKPITALVEALRLPIIKDLYWMNFVFIAAFSMMQITAALLWFDKYGLTDKQIGYVFAFIGISSALIQGFLVGPLNKHFGEKTLLRFGFALMALGLLSMPFVPKSVFIPIELLSLLLIALANACVTPSLLSLLSQHLNPQEQGKYLGLNQSFGSLARVAGPIVGAALYQILYTLPYIFAFIMLLLALAMAFSFNKKWNKKQI